MYMYMPVLLRTLAAVSLPAASALLPPLLGNYTTIIDKPVVKPPFSEARQERDLQKDLPLAPWTYEPWDPDWLPRACVAEAGYTWCDPVDFEAIEVWYQDCAAS